MTPKGSNVYSKLTSPYINDPSRVECFWHDVPCKNW